MPRYFKPFIVGLATIFVGSYLVTLFELYDRFPYIDKFFHFSGGFILAWFFMLFWVNYLKSASSFQRLLTLVGVAALIGIFWEMAEYSTSIPPLSQYATLHHYMYIGSITDTICDLLADICGAVLASLILHFD